MSGRDEHDNCLSHDATGNVRGRGGVTHLFQD